MAKKSSASAVPAAVGAVLAAVSFVAVLLMMKATNYYTPADATRETMDAMQRAVYAAQCAFWIDGNVPASLAQARSTISANPAKAEALYCIGWKVAEAQNVEYAAIDSSHIHLCGKFELASVGHRNPESYAIGGRFTELDEYRPSAGQHCFDIHLQEAPPTEDPWPPVDPF